MLKLANEDRKSEKVDTLRNSNWWPSLTTNSRPHFKSPALRATDEQAHAFLQSLPNFQRISSHLSLVQKITKGHQTHVIRPA